MGDAYPGIERLDIEKLREMFRGVVQEIDAMLSRREELRDELIKRGRDIIKLSGWAINAIHRGSLEEAKKHIEEMDRAAREFIEKARNDMFLWHSGFTNNVLSEYTEAKAFYSLVTEARLPTPQELGVPEVAYLQGIGDTLGELRRLALDLMRTGDLASAERLLDAMETLYYELRALEYPDALIPGVRHKVDVARRLIDDTKALLLTLKARLAAPRGE